MMKPFGKMTLTDLHLDCLESIFRYLPLRDLLNVADSNKQLRKAAELVFSLKHGTKTIEIFETIFKSGSSCPRYSRFLSHWFKTVNLKVPLQLLRCFGHLICKILINICKIVIVDCAESLSIYFGHIIFYIKKYCNFESLTELTVINPPVGVLNNFVKPFPNVHSVGVNASELKSISLNESFPRMRTLTYYPINNCSYRINTHFSNVVHFKINTSYGNWEPAATIQTLQLNPQLHSLSLPFYRDSNIIVRNINTMLPHLQELCLKEIHCFNRSMMFHFETIKRFTIAYGASFTAIPFSFKKLEELNLRFDGSLTCLTYEHEDFYSFIQNHPTILRLTIIGSTRVNLLRLSKMLPLMKELIVDGAYPSNNDIVHLLNRNKSLESVTFGNYIFWYEPDYVMQHTNDKWIFVDDGSKKWFKKAY